MNTELGMAAGYREGLAAAGLSDLRAFAEWVVSLDDDDPTSPGRIDRRTVTLTQIVARARVALGEPR